MNGPLPPAAASWHGLISWLRWSLESLNTDVTLSQVEARAVEVYTSMGGGLRRFHTLEHLFRFEPADALETLAVLYHDVVYWSVDGAWPPSFASVLDAVAEGGPTRPLALSSSIPHYREVLVLFGWNPGDVASKGANELFSALALASALGADLGRERTLAVAACIEATIPFRDPACRTVLRDRLVTLGFASDEADLCVTRAVHVANQDVGDFRLEDPGMFLGGTWNLLPELNPDLRITAVFSIEAYRRALVAMDKFFAFLTPDLLFDAWGSEPGQATLQAWKSQASRNLATARHYLGAKLLATALLEAIARLTGPDAPLSLFMGATSDPSAQRLEGLLPAIPGRPEGDPVYVLLEHGRATDSSFDLTNSPLAAWLYRQLGLDDRNRLLGLSLRLFSGELSPMDYLQSWKSEITQPILRALSSFVPTRSASLSELLQDS